MYNKRKKEKEAAETWDDEEEAGPPTLNLWTESDCDSQWEHMTRTNALVGGTEKTEACMERKVRPKVCYKSGGGEEGESDEGNSESHAAHADSTGQGDDADDATENPVVDNDGED